MPAGPFLVPALARTYEDPNSSAAAREATRLCSTFHRHLGVAVGECLGYLFTGGWTLLVAVAMLQSSSFDDWLAWPGVAVGAFGSRGLTGLKEMLEGSVSHRRTRSPNMPGGR